MTKKNVRTLLLDSTIYDTTISYKNNNDIEILLDVTNCDSFYCNYFYNNTTYISSEKFTKKDIYNNYPTVDYEVPTHVNDVTGYDGVIRISISDTYIANYNISDYIYTVVDADRPPLVMGQPYGTKYNCRKFALLKGYYDDYVLSSVPAITNSNDVNIQYNLYKHILFDKSVTAEYIFNTPTLINEIYGTIYLTTRYAILSGCTNLYWRGFPSTIMPNFTQPPATIFIYGFDIEFNKYVPMGKLIIDENSIFYKKNVDLTYIKLTPMRVSKIKMVVENVDIASDTYILGLLYSFVPKYNSSKANDYISDKLIADENVLSIGKICKTPNILSINSYGSYIDNNIVKLNIYNTFKHLYKYNNIENSGVTINLLNYDDTSCNYNILSTTDYTTNNIDVNTTGVDFIDMNIKYDNIDYNTVINNANGKLYSLEYNNLETHLNIPNKHILTNKVIPLVSYNKYDSTGIVKTITHDICNTVFLHKGATNIKIYGNKEFQTVSIWVIGVNKGETTYTEYMYNILNGTLVQNTLPLYETFSKASPIHINTLGNTHDYYILSVIYYSSDDNVNHLLHYKIEYDIPLLNVTDTSVSNINQIETLLDDVNIIDYKIFYKG